MTKNLAQKILEANIEYHSKLVGDYREQPYINPRNIARVREIIKKLAKETGGGRLLDLGCGTGFIIDIARKYFREVVGLDITPAMLEKVSKAKNVKVVLAQSAKIPFKNNYFDVCTSYSFLHHLHEPKSTIKEIFRVLKRDGVFYNDQDPNYYYYRQLENLEAPMSPILVPEMTSAKNLYKTYKDQYQISKETLDLAEYQRKIKKGLKEEELIKLMKNSGFRDIKVFYQWYVGQGVIEKKSLREAERVDGFLQDLLPISRNLYKYFGFLAKK